MHQATKYPQHIGNGGVGVGGVGVDGVGVGVGVGVVVDGGVVGVFYGVGGVGV